VRTESPPARREYLRSAAARLAGAGVPDPGREVTLLAEAAWELPNGAVWLDAGVPVAQEAAAALEQMLTRRLAGEPLAHVSGLAGFRKLVLRSDARALIPRPETEGLVDLVLSRCATGLAADVCTGSGCVALALADEGRFDRVLGADVSPGAIALARENGARTGLCVEWRIGDLCAPLAGERVDVLVANPPYLTDTEYAELDPAVRDWEPGLALASGVDGLSATRRVLGEARGVVRDGGWIALEVDCRRAGAVAAMAGGLGWAGTEVHEDLFGRARYVLARRSVTS
jgi:release factor glutamine methyltransferase